MGMAEYYKQPGLVKGYSLGEFYYKENDPLKLIYVEVYQESPWKKVGEAAGSSQKEAIEAAINLGNTHYLESNDLLQVEEKETYEIEWVG